MILSWLRCCLERIIIIFSFHTFKYTFACVIWTYSVCVIFHSFVVLSTSSSSEESKGKSALWKDLDILYTICYISISLSIFSSILQSSSTLPWMGTISFSVWIWLGAWPLTIFVAVVVATAVLVFSKLTQFYIIFLLRLSKKKSIIPS